MILDRSEILYVTFCCIISFHFENIYTWWPSESYVRFTGGGAMLKTN